MDGWMDMAQYKFEHHQRGMILCDIQQLKQLVCVFMPIL